MGIRIVVTGPSLGKRLYRNGGVWNLVDWEDIAIVPRGKHRSIQEE
jgi:hypothetical protein